MSGRSLASPICEAGVLREPIVFLRYNFLVETLYTEGASTAKFVESLNQVICE